MDILTKSQFSQTLGLAAEHLVCVDFLRRGFPAAMQMWPHCPYDVLVEMWGGNLRVQVKSSHTVYRKKKHKRKKTGKECYRFGLARGSRKYDTTVDLFAFVVPDVDDILYIPAGSFNSPIGTVPSVKIMRVDTFQEQAKGSLDRFLAAAVEEYIFS